MQFLSLPFYIIKNYKILRTPGTSQKKTCFFHKVHQGCLHMRPLPEGHHELGRCHSIAGHQDASQRLWPFAVAVRTSGRVRFWHGHLRTPFKDHQNGTWPFFLVDKKWMMLFWLGFVYIWLLELEKMLKWFCLTCAWLVDCNNKCGLSFIDIGLMLVASGHSLRSMWYCITVTVDWCVDDGLMMGYLLVLPNHGFLMVPPTCRHLPSFCPPQTFK